MESVNLPKAFGLRNQIGLKFCLTLKQVMESVNLPKACGLRNQT